MNICENCGKPVTNIDGWDVTAPWCNACDYAGYTPRNDDDEIEPGVKAALIAWDQERCAGNDLPPLPIWTRATVRAMRAALTAAETEMAKLAALRERDAA